MSDTKHVVVTREGLQRMKEELEYKETTEKMKVAEQLKVAISYGDLSENAEYDAAKNDQAVLEQRIAELKAMIENAVVVDESKISTDTVGFGTRVTIVYEDDPDEEETYTIVARPNPIRPTASSLTSPRSARRSSARTSARRWLPRRRAARCASRLSRLPCKT